MRRVRLQSGAPDHRRRRSRTTPARMSVRDMVFPPPVRRDSLRRFVSCFSRGLFGPPPAQHEFHRPLRKHHRQNSPCRTHPDTPTRASAPFRWSPEDEDRAHPDAVASPLPSPRPAREPPDLPCNAASAIARRRGHGLQVESKPRSRCSRRRGMRRLPATRDRPTCHRRTAAPKIHDLEACCTKDHDRTACDGTVQDRKRCPASSTPMRHAPSGSPTTGSPPRRSRRGPMADEAAGPGSVARFVVRVLVRFLVCVLVRVLVRVLVQVLVLETPPVEPRGATVSCRPWEGRSHRRRPQPLRDSGSPVR